MAGIYEYGVEAYLDVPYAQDAGAFKACKDVEPWSGVRDASKPAPLFWQTDHQIVVHPKGDKGSKVEIEQSSDAFRMSIWTPSTSGKRPVVMWIHGGGFSSGGCSLPQYNGARIARDADVVFAGVNYRLGALGNIPMPGSPSNLSVRDLLSALAWLRRNAQAFGGDPDDIVIAGQSAGAWNAVAIAASGQARGMFSRLMLMSSPSTQPLSNNEMLGLVDALKRHLKIDDLSEIANIPPDKLIIAQRKAAKEAPRFGVSFTPYDDGELLSGDMFAKAMDECGNDIPVLIGLLDHESTFFMHFLEDTIREMDFDGRTKMLDRFKEGAEIDSAKMLEQSAKKIASDDPYWTMIDATTELTFGRIAHRLASGMGRSWMYEIGIKGTGGRGATHCLELPFVFGNLEYWQDDPAMEGLSQQSLDLMMESFRPAVLEFLRSGCPVDPKTGEWKPYSEGGSVRFE